MKRKGWILFLLVFFASAIVNSVNAQDEERGKLFRNGNYAMFIHWGLYSQMANVWNGATYYGISEWLMSRSMANIDRTEYRASAKTFNPTEFDAMKIAQLAKDAGMKYIIITSKHHEGFAMFKSNADGFNIVDATPFHRDPMKELSDACRKLGLGFGFYYSHNQDWTYPGGGSGPRVDAEGNQKTFDDYFQEKCLPQVEEITKNYGDIELVWFDTPGSMPKKYAETLVEVVHRNQPKALVSGRVGYDMGDYVTLNDIEIPFKNMEGLWETVDVTNDTWGYSWYDNNWKSPRQIITNLITTVARGGTYMLNVGPDGKGNIPEFAAQSLRAAGQWISRHPQVIYGAQASPWGHALPWGDVVKQGKKLYLAVFDWPRNGKLFLPGLKSDVSSAEVMVDGKTRKLKYSNSDNFTIIEVPTKRPDELVSIIQLTMKDDNVEVDNSIAIDPELGLKNLSVAFAECDGCEVKKDSWMEKFGEWKHIYTVEGLNKGGSLIWMVLVDKPGVYNIDLCLKGDGKSVWRVTTDEGNFVQNQQRSTAIYNDRPMGWLSFDKAGKHTLKVTMPEKGNATSIASISLTPVTF